MLNYRIEGEGPPLLLIHGFGVSFRIWQNLTAWLCPHYRLIMLELPGINASPMPPAGVPYYDACASAIIELREYLGIERWSILAYSAGARAAETYLQQDAARIEKAILLCPALVSRLGVLVMRVFVGLNSCWPALVEWIVSGWRFHALIVLLAFNGRPHPYAADWMSEIDLQPIAVRIATLAELPGYGGAPLDLPKLPVHFIWGRYDLIGRPARYPTEGSRIIPANHAAPVLAAPLVASAILDCLTP